MLCIIDNVRTKLINYCRPKTKIGRYSTTPLVKLSDTKRPGYSIESTSSAIANAKACREFMKVISESALDKRG